MKKAVNTASILAPMLWLQMWQSAHAANPAMESNRRPNASVHGYVAAYCRADARRLIEEYTGQNPTS